MSDLLRQPFSRRRLLAGSSGVVAYLALPGCVPSGEEASGLSAWAGKVPDQTRFVQSVGWVESNDFGGRTAAMAFVPFELDASQRRAVVSNGSVFPVLPDKAPMLEARLYMDRPREGQKVGVGTLRKVKLTFWNFAEPTPVVTIEQRDWASSPDLQIDGLDGNLVPGGWMDGTIRGRRILQGETRRDAYVWNLQVAMSLD